MAVSAFQSILIRPWRGYDDPGLPVGMWYAQQGVTGDLTGGNMTVIFGFKDESEPVSGRFFNLEQFICQRGGSVTTAGGFQITNFETIGPVGLVNRNWRFELESNGNSQSPISNNTYLPVPLFLGSVAPVASLAAQLEIDIPNVNNTTFVVTAQGYIWEPRSIQAEGGLRRPADSLYGR